MRGHEALIAMRLRGVAPSDVHVETVPTEVWRDWQSWAPQHAHILIETGDRVDRLDLRCLVGLLVIVNGEDRERVSQVVEACAAAGARRVVSFTMEDPRTAPDSILITDSIA